MPALTITNSQAPIHDGLIRGIAEWLTRYADVPVEYVPSGDWAWREQRLDAGEIDMGWICGAPYVDKRRRGVGVDLLAAPVMMAPRYSDRPVYFSDVIVRSESSLRNFDALRGMRWAFNEPRSHSGYHVVRYFMWTLGLRRDFFGEVIQSGAHQASVDMILRGEADASAIDSTVLELLMAVEPALGKRLRVIDSIGPSPMPPLVTGTHVAGETRDRLENALTHMHENAAGRELLASARMARLARVEDRDYDAIRAMLTQAQPIAL